VNNMEDRLRDAYRAATDTIDPDSLPGPGVQVVRPAVPGGRAARRRTAPRSRRLRLALPVAAAVATGALVLAVTALAPHAATQHPATQHPATIPVGPAASASALPPFTVVVWGDSLTVFDTASGTIAGNMNSPQGQQFMQVAPDGNARTFIVSSTLASSAACSATFYRLQLTDDGAPLSLTSLRTVPGYTPSALAVDGGTLAYSVAHCATGNGPGPSAGNTVIGYIGDAQRRWTFTLDEDYATALSASATGTLAFAMVPGSGLNEVAMVLHTASRSGAIAATSRVVVPGPGTVQSVALSPDGKTLYACNWAASTETLAAYNTATGRRIDVLHSWHTSAKQNPSCHLGVDGSGRYLLAEVSVINVATSSSELSSTTTLTGYRLGSATPIPIGTKLAEPPSGEFGGGGSAW
jgi:hypothetical protein